MKQLEMNVIFSLNSWGLNGIFFVYLKVRVLVIALNSNTRL